jgi:hypothetical protein
VIGRRKTIPPRGVELAQDKGEFRPGLYDRDMHELRAMLSTLDQKELIARVKDQYPNP